MEIEKSLEAQCHYSITHEPLAETSTRVIGFERPSHSRQRIHKHKHVDLIFVLFTCPHDCPQLIHESSRSIG